MSKKLIIYERLSDEDEVERDESNSIKNQRILINNYIQKYDLAKGLEVQEYFDDGYSGKNFERPGFQLMLDKIKSRMVEIIIVKDFSRFGRDYIELGRYIDMIFPFMNIRFIAINNQYDSNDYKNRTPGIEVPFQNLVYDFYSEDLSANIKKAFQIKREKGEYFGSKPTYGYLLNPNKKGVQIRDPIAGEIVGNIIRMRRTLKKGQIRDKLNEQRIMTPAAYLNKMGYKIIRESPVWTIRMITNIVQNPVHIGVTASGKRERLEVSSTVSSYVPREQWTIIWNTHEPNVPLDIFLEVQELEGIDVSYLFRPFDSTQVKPIVVKPEKKRTIKSGKYVLPQDLRDSPVKGRVFCGGCHHKMYRQRYKNKGMYYFCTYTNKLGIEDCSHGVIYEEQIEKFVLETINKQCLQLEKIREIIQIKKESIDKERKNKKLEIVEITNKIDNLKIRKKKLLTDFQLGKMSDAEYTSQKVVIMDQINDLNHRLNCSMKNQEDESDDYRQCIDLSINEVPIKILTKDIVDRMVDRIEIYNGKKVQVVLKYQDVFVQLAEKYM